MNRVMLFRVAIMVLIACADLVPDARAGGAALTSVRLIGGLNLPSFVTHAPGDPYRIYVLEKPGRILILDLRNLGAPPIVFLDINTRVGGGTSLWDERGLLGLAFHPQYETNGLLYVNFTSSGATGLPPADDSVIAEYARSTPDSADPASERIVLVVDQPAQNHNGGWLGFGPNDGLLYASFGDGGGQNDQFGNGQDTSTLQGTILRIDVDGSNAPGGQYGYPSQTPFNGVNGLREIWAYGLRNPWRPSFDRQTGDLYIADVGQNLIEEISFQPASSLGGENYGWRCFEGDAVFPVGFCNPLPGGTVLPFHTYRHDAPPFGCSISGGYVYRGCAIPSLDGSYFFADFCSNDIWSLTYTGGTPPFVGLTPRAAELAVAGFTISSIASFGEDAFGELYIVDHAGEIFKIVPASGIADCNANNVDDACEIQAGLVEDANGNGIPDVCGGPCPGDADGDRDVDFDDITSVLANWLVDYSASPSGTGPGDSDRNGVVTFDDVTSTLAQWLAQCL